MERQLLGAYRVSQLSQKIWPNNSNCLVLCLLTESELRTIVSNYEVLIIALR